jgi:hypothetical protein
MAIMSPTAHLPPCPPNPFRRGERPWCMCHPPARCLSAPAGPIGGRGHRSSVTHPVRAPCRRAQPAPRTMLHLSPTPLVSSGAGPYRRAHQGGQAKGDTQVRAAPAPAGNPSAGARGHSSIVTHARHASPPRRDPIGGRIDGAIAPLTPTLPVPPRPPSPIRRRNRRPSHD